MNIFFVAPRFHTNQFAIVKKMIEEGNRVHFYVVTREGSEDHSILYPTFIKPSSIFKFFINKRKYFVPSIIFILKIFKKYTPDVVIIRNPHYVYCLIFLIFSYLFKSKIILYTQDPYYLINIKLRHLYYLLILHLLKAKWITPVLGNRKLGKIISKDLYHLILPIEVNKRKKLEITKSNKQIFNMIMVGKFVEWKNHLLLIEAVRKISNSTNYILSLTIIGECTTEEHKKVYNKILQTIKDYKLSKMVKTKINLEYKEVLNEYSKHDLFILPSSDEVYSFSPLEAMSNMLPVIISNKNGFQYNIKNGFNGYIFDADNLDDLIEKLIMLVENDKFNAMGENAYKYVENEFLPEYYYSKLLSIINSI